MRIFGTIGLLVVALMVSSCGDGQSTDNGSEFGPWVYSTSEPGDYTLNMAKSVWADEKEPTKILHSEIVLTTKIPKSLLSVCFPYSRKQPQANVFKVQSLPDEVFCNKISFVMNYVDGEDWKGSEMLRGRDNLEKFLRERPKPDPLIFGKVPADESNVDFRRYFKMKADVSLIHPSKNLAEVERFIHGAEPKNKIGTYDGFDVHKNSYSERTTFIDASAADGIQTAFCVSATNNTRPEFFCSAIFRLNENVYVELDFIDFRVHGGRRFLQERVRAFKKYVCPILKCSDAAMSAAEVVGGF
jgi:hypothetical protein